MAAGRDARGRSALTEDGIDIDSKDRNVFVSADVRSDRPAQISTDGIWFGASDRPALGWLSVPAHGIGSSGVVIAPPLGYAYWSSHRTLRVLAERLAAAGHAVLRIDYDGTGDSAGDQWEPDRVTAWRGTLLSAAEELKAQGAQQLTLIGVRLGATFALLDARTLAADRVVAWMPVTSGRRFAKELTLLSTEVPAAADPLDPRGTRVVAGNVFSVQTLRDLASMDLTGLSRAPAPKALVIDDPTGPSVKAVNHLRSVGVGVDHLKLGGSEHALETAPEFATVPKEIVAAICDWVGLASESHASSAQAVSRPQADFRWRGELIGEQVVRIGSRGHIAVITSPNQLVDRRATLVLLNPGSESHVGPGRAWVEYARELALLGRRSIRVDFLGWGESPDEGRAPGRPYDACGVRDTVEIIEGLQKAGFDRLVMCGLCASAWIALRAALSVTVAGVIALNPQLYWKPGDIVGIDWDVIRTQRASEIRRIERGARAGIWSLLDAVGHRPRAAKWLDELAATRIPIQLLFADGDDGLIYLDGRLRRRLQRVSRSGQITVREMPGVDHPMHRTWMRPLVVQAISEALERIDPGQARPSTQRGRDHICQRSSS